MTKLSPTTHELEFQKWLELAYENERRRLTEEIAAKATSGADDEFLASGGRQADNGA